MLFQFMVKRREEHLVGKQERYHQQNSRIIQRWSIANELSYLRLVNPASEHLGIATASNIRVGKAIYTNMCRIFINVATSAAVVKGCVYYLPITAYAQRSEPYAHHVTR